MGLAARPHAPDQEPELGIEDRHAILKLCDRYIRRGERRAIERVLMHVPYDPNDLADRLLIKGRAKTFAEEELVSQSVAVRPRLTSERFVDDHERRRSAAIAPRKA